MKIVHLLTYYGSYLGGLQIYVKEVAKRQKAEGHEVVIITSKIYGNEKKIDGIKIIRSPVLFSAFRVPLLPSLPFQLLKEKCDILHVHLPSPGLDLAAGLKKIISPRTKLIVTVHNSLPEQKGIGKVFELINNHVTMNFALSLSDKIIVSTKAFAKELELNKNKNKLYIIPVGVDLKKFRIISKKKKNQILFVGRLVPEKGLLDLVRAIKSLRKKQDIKIKAIVSEVYGQFSSYKELCKKEGKGFLELEYNIPNEKLLSYYNESQCFVFPSIGLDSFGIVLIEAMACGIPVVSTDLVGPASLVKPFNGITFKRGDIKDLEKKISLVLERKYNAQELRTYVEKNFNWDGITKQINEVYVE